MEELNVAARSSNFLPCKKLKDLIVNEQYKVTTIKIVTTKYGKKAVVELNNSFDIFLPKKASDLLVSNETLYNHLQEDIHEKEVKLKYLGGYAVEFI